MDKEQQELMFKFQMFEQQIQGIQQQLQAVENAIVELTSLSLGTEELKGKTGKEILAPMGKGVFVKTKLLSEDLVVDVGGGNFVKKDIDSTKNLIGGQVKKLEGAREELNKAMEEINSQLTQTMINSQKKSKK